MTNQSSDDVAVALSREIGSFLESAGSHRVHRAQMGNGPLHGIFEDALTVVGYVVYQTVAELLTSWMDAQDQMAKVISLSDFDLGAKAWDGYLVLATPEQATPDQSLELTGIRSNTRRLRKLLVLGEDVQLTGERSLGSGVARSLAALAPLELPLGTGMADPLASLGSRVQVPGLSAADIDAVVSAYRESRPLIQVLHRRTSENEAT